MQKVRKDELGALAREVLARVPTKGERAAIIVLHGDLGAGKTTFTQELAKELGVTETVQSPTYVLMRSYGIDFGRFKKLIHIDAYRLESPEQFAQLAPERFLGNPINLVIIEWPERIEGTLPTPDLVLKFSSQDAGDGERYIEVA